MILLKDDNSRIILNYCFQDRGSDKLANLFSLQTFL